MNLEHYKNFIAVADEGTISGAAKKLLIAQPALSTQMKGLEQEYGAQLFVRGSRHIELTDAGRVLYNRSKTICYLEDAVRKEIDACRAGDRGTLWFGTTPAGPDRLLRSLLLDFHAANPLVSYEIFEQNSGQILQLLSDNVIEIGLVRTRPTLPPDIESVLTLEEHMMVYYHRDHPAFGPERKSVFLEELEHWPISLAKGLREMFVLACQYQGFEPELMNVCNSRGMSQLWAEDKRTVAVVVASQALDLGDFCYRPIEGDAMRTRRSFVVRRERELSAVARSFLSFCAEHQLLLERAEKEA